MLADYLIPRDERSGQRHRGRRAGFIDFIMVDRPELQTPMRGGRWLDSLLRRRVWSRVRRLRAADRRTRARRHRIAPTRSRSRISPGASSSSQLQGPDGLRVLEQSGMGVKDLQYLGNAVVHEWSGCPQAALDKLRRELLAAPSSRLHVLPCSAMAARRLGIGLIGSGSMRSFICRDSSVSATRTFSVCGARIQSAPPRPPPWPVSSVSARRARSLDRRTGRRPAIDAIWLCGPNFSRVENVEEIVDALERGRGELLGIACEKPLARTVAEAQRVTKLVKRAEISHGYLENQVFAPAGRARAGNPWARGARLTGRPYLARAAEEHSGPHSPWFWQGRLQGRRCAQRHDVSLRAARPPLLDRAGHPVDRVRPVRVTAHIASLKWSTARVRAAARPPMGSEVDYRRPRPRTSRA